MSILSKENVLSVQTNNFIKKFSLSARREIKKSKEFYSQFIKPSSLCFDVGANLGNRTYIFEKLGAKVVAIEPQNFCRNVLEKLFANNKSITIVSKALGEQVGTGQISICDEANVVSSMSDRWMKEGRFSKAYHWNTFQKIEITTLDKLIEEFGVPDFCKIDVEGFEKNVLRGLSYKIKALSFEFTKELFTDSVECLDILEKISDFEANYSLGESMMLVLNKWVKKNEIIKIISDIDDHELWGDIYIRTK